MRGFHRADDRLDLFHFLVGGLSRYLFRHAAKTGHHIQQLVKRSHLFYLLQLIEEILKRKITLQQPFSNLLRLFLVNGLLCPFNQAKHVAHTQNT
jgi:hypothetical protein